MSNRQNVELTKCRVDKMLSRQNVVAPSIFCVMMPRVDEKRSSLPAVMCSIE
jgi:hypothetical protein